MSSLIQTKIVISLKPSTRWICECK